MTPITAKHAFYHQQGKPPLKLEVLKEHEDGTLDLGVSGPQGRVVISQCEIRETEEAGYCTLPSEAELKAAKKQAARELRQKAVALDKKALAASKAAKEAEGKANHAELVKAADDAANAAAQADADAEEAEKDTK